MTTERETRALIQQLVAGQLTRRAFIVRAAALGCSAPAIAGLLAACGGAPAATAVQQVAPTVAAAATQVAPTVAAAATAAAGGAASPAASASPAGSPAAGGGNALGAKTDMPLGAGGGLAPGPTKRGGAGQLKMLWWQAPTILNPHLSQGSKDYDASRLVYEPLASFGPDDKLVPFLAADIPSTANGGVAADGKSVTWTLKQGVKWADGQPFSADDVVFTWQFATDPQTAAVTQGVYKGIDKVEAVDPTTVKVTFKDVTPGWYTVFTGIYGMILPQHVFKDGMGAAAKNFPANLKPVGTGPYKVDNFAPGDVVNYSINANWRDSNSPSFDTVEMKGGGDAVSAARAVFQTGDYQVGWNLQVEVNILKQLTGPGAKGQLVLTEGGGIERILVNQTDPNKEVNGQRSEKNTPHPFQADPQVRQAYTYLCDKKTVADTLYGPAGQPTGNILTTPAQYASPNTKWSFDIEKAKSMLDAAGWTLNGQYRAKGGVQMAVVFQTSTNPVRQKHQQIVKDAFEKAGIKMDLKNVDAGVYFSSDAGNPDTASHFYTDLEMFTNSNDSPDPWNYFEGWSTTEIAQKENQWNGNNYERWSNKDYDALVAQAKTELDGAKRGQLFIQMNDMVVNNVVDIPQIDRKGVTGFANALQNVQPSAWDATAWNIANWTLKG
ncbi:MAG TPA: peptide ABC transporter substrate-binding protein [Thermomicrobiales bacterium]|nr:peptide ABC transporter substrate-binding protein [Thermomicrobiales bacterium]